MITYAKFRQLSVWTIKSHWKLPDYIFWNSRGEPKRHGELWLAIAGR